MSSVDNTLFQGGTAISTGVVGGGVALGVGKHEDALARRGDGGQDSVHMVQMGLGGLDGVQGIQLTESLGQMIAAAAEVDTTAAVVVQKPAVVGDGGVSDVISLEAVRAIYEGDGDVTVPMTVGFGHLPNPNHKLGCGDSFYVHYKVIKMSSQAGEDDVTVWEKKVDYPDCWFSAKYESTEQKNYPFLFIPHYGEFYPPYKENVEIVFPADVERGIVEVEINAVKESDTSPFIHKLSFYFFRTDGVLTLNH